MKHEDKNKEELTEEVKLLQKRIGEAEKLRNEQKQFEELLLLERKFNAAVLENIDAGVVACNEKGELVLFNRVARAWHGLDPMKIPQKEWAGHYDLYLEDGVTPMDINTVPLARAFRGEEVHSVGMVIAAKGQPKHHLITNAGPIKGEGGQILGAVAIMHDITERKKAEEILRSKTAILEAQLNSSIDGILIVDNQGKKIIQNQRTVELWKIPQNIADNNDDEAQVQHVKSMTRNPKQFVEKIVHLYNYPNETSRDEVELIDGTVFDRYSAPVLGKEGQNYGRIWIFRDITERKKLEEELQKRLHEMETFYKASIGREERIIELKKEVENLKKKLGK